MGGGQDATHRAAKVHLAFEVFRHGPADATLPAGGEWERGQLRDHLRRAGRVYVRDRGSESRQWLADIRTAGRSFVARLQSGAAFQVGEERPRTAAGRAAGVTREWASEPELEAYLRRAQAKSDAKARKAKVQGPSG